MREGINLLESASSILVSDAARMCWDDMKPGLSVVITAHRSPDGDAVGAALGLHHHLKAVGVDSSVVLPDRFPAFLDWMPGTEGICFYDADANAATELLNGADIIWCLDFNGLDRVGKMEDALRNAPGQKWVVDHHQLPDDFADRLLSDPTCGSTCELLVDLIAGWRQTDRLTQEAMMCLYVGIMTDTGSFRFPSVTAHTHAVLAHFLSCGLDHAAIHQNTFDEQSLNRVQLQGFAMSERLHVYNEQGLAIVHDPTYLLYQQVYSLYKSGDESQAIDLFEQLLIHTFDNSSRMINAFPEILEDPRMSEIYSRLKP